MTLTLKSLACCLVAFAAMNACKTQQTSGKDIPAPAPPSTPAPAPTPSSANEEINPPQPMTGSYLYCEAIGDKAAAALESTIGCVIKKGSSAQTVDIKVEFTSVVWSASSLVSGVAIEKSAEVSNATYQQIFTVKSLDGQPIGARASSVQMDVVIVSAATGSKETKSTTIDRGVVRWMSLNGAKIPSNAVAGGSEAKHSIPHYVCRMYTGNKIVLGKLIDNFGIGSVCYANSLGAYFQSNVTKTGEFQFASDVLIIENVPFDQLLEWKDVTGLGTTDLALGANKGSQEPLHSCRVLNDGSKISNTDYKARTDPLGEYQVGELRPGAGCYYNFFDNLQSTTYQVLSWKTVELRNLMDSRLNSP